MSAPRELHDSDVRLMLDVVADRPAAFERLVARFAPVLVNFLYRQTGAHDAAEDLAQEVFLRVYRSRHRYHPMARLQTWLLTIATNVFLNRERYEGYRRHVSLDAPLEDGAPNPSLPDTHGETPHSSAERDELKDRVRAAVAELPPSQRLAVDLLRFSGLTYKEIAAAMGISVQATKSLLNRAKANLRASLEHDIKDYLRLGQAS